MTKNIVGIQRGEESMCSSCSSLVESGAHWLTRSNWRSCASCVQSRLHAPADLSLRCVDCGAIYRVVDWSSRHSLHRRWWMAVALFTCVDHLPTCGRRTLSYAIHLNEVFELRSNKILFYCPTIWARRGERAVDARWFQCWLEDHEMQRHGSVLENLGCLQLRLF